jgi:hypothetical protein
MQATTLQLYSLSYSQAKTYIAAAVFILGNVIVPQLFHFIPGGGLIFLPIYFFTLVGAYKYGWRVGLLTAIASPLVNSALFGMPMAAMLPVIIAKSALLAIAAGWAAYSFKRISVLILTIVVLAYQVVGTLVEWALVGDFVKAVQDFRIGLPGMALQVLGGYWVIKFLGKTDDNNNAL